jgi:hypothetical protein
MGYMRGVSMHKRKRSPRLAALVVAALGVVAGGDERPGD